MYIRLSKIMTKSYFRTILNDSVNIAKEEYEAAPDIELNKSIYNQLLDIRKTVVDEDYSYSEEDAAKKYSLGVIVIRNYGEYDEWDYPKRLSDISWGISLYPSMKEDNLAKLN